MNKYFKIGSDEWKITVKYSIKIGFILGLLCGYLVVINAV